MKARHIGICVITLVLIGAVTAGAVQTLSSQNEPLHTQSALKNVRDYVSATEKDGLNYAVDSGQLYVGAPGAWTQVRTPEHVVISAVAVDPVRQGSLYVGAADEMALYRSRDSGQSWLRVPLADTAGGITDIAVDSFQRLVYVGTDTAGVFRLRDVGSSVILSGQLQLDYPVKQIAADSTGAGLAFALTEQVLYRAENYGMGWSAVDGLDSTATAVVVANSDPATIYVGTTDRGILESSDGLTWSLANEGLGFPPGSRLHIDALAVDQAGPDVMYAASSYLYANAPTIGNTPTRRTSSRVFASADGAQEWSMLNGDLKVSITDLLPVSGYAGAVYALTTTSRTPLALGKAHAVDLNLGTTPAMAMPNPEAADVPAILAWVLAAIASSALVFAISYDLRVRRQRAAASNSRPSGSSTHSCRIFSSTTA